MKQITAQELKEKIACKADFYLVDVREDFEHAAFDIGGELIPFGEIMSKAASIPTDKMVILYCRKGVRSQIAIQRLEDKFGFTNLVNLEGGLDKWA
jgi:rhodanese-related sulfurtransferase